MPIDDRLPRDRTSAKWRNFAGDVLPLWVAEMDYPLAPPIAEALESAVRRSDTGYRWIAGLPEALADFAQRRLGWALDPARVTVVGDVLVAMDQCLRRLVPSGGAVVITTPVYPPFHSTVRRIVERELVEVPLADGGLDLQALESQFSRPEVTAFLMSNPHNPTGRIHSEDELRRVAELAREHNVVVVADEIWAPLPLHGRRAFPYLTLGEDLTGPDVSLISASKAFSLAGLKCAQIVAGSQATHATLTERLPVEVTYSAGHFGVLAAIAGYSAGDAWLDETLERISENADHLAALLAKRLPGVAYAPPEATYLAWLDCRSLGLDDPAAFFLEKARVGLNNGADFGAPGAGFVRMNLATYPEVIEEAVERMAAAMNC